MSRIFLKVNKNNLFSLIKYLIGWPLSAIALIFVFKVVFTNLSQTIQSIIDINPYLLLTGIVFFVIYLFLRAYLWMLILGTSSRHFTLKENMLYWSISELKRYVPGSIWAFASRATSFEREKLTKKQIFIFIAHEAIIVCLSALMFSLFYIFYAYGNQISNYLLLAISCLLIFIFIFGSKILNKFSNESILKKIAYFFLPNNSYFENFKILAFGILTFSTFGLASYFCTVSLFYISLQNILIISSLFTFSYFIGYVSIITPMGLGVREGISTIGLLNFLPQVLGATASIFTRTMSVFAEIISIALIIIVNKIKLKHVKKIENFIFTHKQEVILCFFILIYISYFTITSFLRYSNFYTGRFDLGNMDQTVWNTIHGRIFQLTDPDGINNISRLSVHADFILILISPLYLIWSNPKMLLLFQTLVLASGAFFTYLISKEILKNKNISLTIALAFLLNPAVQFTNLYDFHSVTLATTLLLACFYFFIKRRLFLFLLFGVLAATTKEEVWVVLGIFGLFFAISSYLKNKKDINWKNIILGITFFFFSSTITYILISKIIPLVKGGDHFALSYYSDFGNSASGIIKTILFNPLKTLSIFLESSRLNFLFQLFSPLGFLSLLSPVFLFFAMPDLLIDLLSNNPQLHQIYYQYSAIITPFIFISAIYACNFLVTRFKKIKIEYLAIYILIATLTSAYFTGPLPGSRKPNIDMFSKQLTNSNLIGHFLSKIPKQYSIAATNNLGAHISRRQNIYNIPIGLDKADVIVFLLDHGFSAQSIKEQKQMVEKLKQNPDYSLVIQDKDFYEFKKTNLPLKM